MAGIPCAGVVMTFCMLALVSPVTMGDGVTWAAPLFFLLLFTLVPWQQKCMKLCSSALTLRISTEGGGPCGIGSASDSVAVASEDNHAVGFERDAR